jgi:hypothetical protein
VVLRVLRSVVVFVLLAGGMLSIAVGGASAAGWVAPDSASLAVNDLDFDEQGNAIAVGVGADPGGDPMIRATTRPFGGQWSASVAVSGDDDSDASAPRVAVDPQGNAVAAWRAFDEVAGRRVVRVSSRPAGGAWSTPITISPGTVFADDHDVAIDGQGNATVIWTDLVESTFVVSTASRPHGGTWSAVVELSDSDDGNADKPQLAVDSQGNATAVWIWAAPHPSGTGTIGRVRAKSRPAGGAWSSAAVALSEDGRAEAPQVAVDPQGNATAIWQSYGSGGYVVRTARRAAGGDWSATVDLASGLSPSVAVDLQGNATAIWVSSPPNGVIRSSRKPAGGSWSAPVDMATGSGTAKVGFPWVAVDPQDNTTAIWARYNASEVTAQAARSSAGGNWSAAVDLPVEPSLTELPAAGVDPQGHTTLAWSSSGSPWSGPWTGASSVFDPVAPELRNPAVPATGIVGQPVAMSVDPFDAWSAVTTSWNFGDSQSASGAAVDHAYNSPGERTVTITGVDAAGNTTQTSRAITILPVPDPGNPGPGPSPNPNPGPGPTPGPGPSAKAPVVSGVRQSRSRWRTPGTTRRPRLPIGTTFRFKLDRAAKVRLAFAQVVPGRRVAGRCVKATKANRKKGRCNRFRARGTLTIAGKAGKNARAFRGKIGRRTLKPGRYRLLVTATADGKTSTAVARRFKIAR